MSFRKRSVRNNVMAELVILFSLLSIILHFSSSTSFLPSLSYEVEANSYKEQRYWLKKAVSVLSGRRLGILLIAVAPRRQKHDVFFMD
jgi:hypothetical protein